MRLPLALLIAAPASCGSSEPEPEPILCVPGADSSGETAWLAEGEAVSIVIGCLGDGERAGDELAVPELPAGAVYDPASATLSWTPGLDQAAVWNLAVEVIETGESGVVTIGVADAFDDPDNVPVLDRAAYSHEYGLPVLFLDHGPSQSDVDEPVIVTYGGRTIDARGEKRGASSLSYPKNSYLLKFENDAQFYDLDREFVARRRVVLTSTFDDNSYVRQRLVFELWNALEPTLPIETYSVVVYIGDEFWGLYTLTDHPSKHWLEGLELRGDANLYKAYNHDANFRDTDLDGNPKATLHQGYEKKEGVPDDFTDLDELVNFSITASEAEFRRELGNRIDVADYSKWWALVVFTLATDSAGKNSYHYRDQTISGAKFTVAPWDFNASFGQSWETSRLPVELVSKFGNRNELWRRSLEDPTLGPALRDVLRDAIASGPFSAALDDRMAAMISEVEPVSRRDWRKWGADYLAHPRWNGRTDMTDYDGELSYLLNWVASRRANVLAGIE